MFTSRSFLRVEYYTIIEFGIGCSLDLSTWNNVIYLFKGRWARLQPKSMIVLFHENILLLSTYKFIVIPITYRNFGVFVYDAAEKQMINAISLVIEQRKNEFDRIARVRFFQNLLSCPASVISLSDTCQALCLAEMVFPNLFVCLARVISLSRHLPGSIFSREGDIASTQNLLLSFKPIICKLNYSHVKKHFIKERY